LINAITIAGLMYAVYGLSLYASGTEMVLWVKKLAYTGDVTSTFYNKNSYATYAGLGLLCAVGLLLTAPFENVAAAQKHGRTLRRCGWRSAAAICLAAAVLFTHSRAGFVCAGIGLIALLVLLGVSGAFPWRYVLASDSAVVTAVAVLFVLVGGRTAGGLATIGVLQPSGGLETRLEIYRLVLHALADAPLLGTGYGTFADVFRSYRGTVVEGFWDHAHNTYLENAMELGIPATVCLLAAIGGVLAACTKGLRCRDQNPLYPCLGLAATVQVGIHALFDFSVEMPGIAITYAALLGTASARCWNTQRSTATNNECGRSCTVDLAHLRSGGWSKRILAVEQILMRMRGWWPPALATLVGLTLFGLAVPHSIAAFLTLPHELTATAVRQAQIRNPAVIDNFIAGELAAVRWFDDGRFWANIAAANLNRLSIYALIPEVMPDAANQVKAALEHSLERKPSDPYIWAELAEFYLVLRRDPIEIGKALNLSLLTGPGEWKLVLFRCRLALIVWPYLDQDIRSRFGQQFVMATARFGERFAKLALRLDRVQSVHDSLGIDQEQQKRFEAIIARLRRS
jgi:O-antigen ligase